MSGRIALREWTLCVPGLPDKEAALSWLRGQTPSPDAVVPPPCAEVPMALRRRMTLLARMCAQAYFDVLRGTGIALHVPPVILASDAGEIGILDALLSTLHRREALSPTDFCNSVHHTATGYLSMAVSHRGLSRTVSAGADTALCGLLEAACLLSLNRAEAVVVLVADEPVPARFGAVRQVSFPHCAAMLLGRAGEGEGGWTAAQLAARFGTSVPLSALLTEGGVA